MKRFLAKTPLFFRKIRNTAIAILTVSGIIGQVSKDEKVQEVCSTIMLVGGSVGITAQGAKDEE